MHFRSFSRSLSLFSRNKCLSRNRKFDFAPNLGNVYSNRAFSAKVPYNIDFQVKGLDARVHNPHEDGIPVILICGWAGTKDDWGAFPKLITGRPVITFSPRGLGNSTFPEPYSRPDDMITCMAEDSIAVLEGFRSEFVLEGFRSEFGVQPTPPPNALPLSP